MKLLLRTLAVAVVVLGAAAGGAWMWLRGSLPAMEGTIELAGLSAPVRIVRDRNAVPHVYAENVEDVMYGLGFVHAQDRLWQMEINRRVGAGRLAEVLGAPARPADRFLRTLGVHRAAERAYAELDRRTRGVLDSYAAGVNAFLDARDGPLPPEFLILRHRPEPWAPQDSLAWGKMVAWDLARNWRRELLRLRLVKLAGVPPDRLFELFPPYPGDAPVALPDLAGVWSEAPVEAAGAPAPATAGSPANGPNGWVLGGARTTTGKPLLANDPHLDLGAPSVWYLAHLDCPEFRAIGATLPGIPGIVLGRNDRIAWGFTNGNIDSQDLRAPAAGARPDRTDAERIEVRFGAGETLEVRSDAWGPLLGPNGGGRALRWTAHRLEGAHINFRRIERAADVDEALGLFQRSGIPGQNVLVVDRAGNAAWTIAGPLFRRGGRDGRLPAAAAETPPAWLPADEYPVVRNPPDGRLWSANSRHVGGAAFALLGDGRYAYAARARRIRDRLRERERFAEADLLDVQLDRRADHLRPWRARLERVLDHPRAAAATARRDLRARLAAWDGRSAADSIAYRVLRTFRKRCHERFLLVLQTRLGGRPDARMRELRWQIDGPLDRILAADARHFLPQGMRDWDEFLARALAQTLEELDAGGNDDREERIGHLLSRALPFLGPWLDAPADPLPGDLDVVRVERGDFGASERMVVAPGREEQGLLHMPGGQSGHPLSPFYLAGHADWVAGRPTPFLPGPERHRLRLAPSED